MAGLGASAGLGAFCGCCFLSFSFVVERGFSRKTELLDKDFLLKKCSIEPNGGKGGRPRGHSIPKASTEQIYSQGAIGVNRNVQAGELTIHEDDRLMIVWEL